MFPTSEPKLQSRRFTPETRTIAVSDRLQWREPDNARRIANGQYATITALHPQ
jgi:hypothetical protein